MIRASIVCACVVCAAAGCGPRDTLPAPQGWPAEFAGRSLYNTPGAFIYASSPAAAGEADRLVRSVADDFERQFCQPMGKGLVIVTRDDDPCYAPTAELYAILRRQQASGLCELPDKAERLEHGLEPPNYQYACGMSTGRYVRINPIIFHCPSQSLLCLPAEALEQACWAVAIPTDGALRSDYWRSYRSVASDREVGLPVLAVSTIYAVWHPVILSPLSAQRKVAIYAAAANSVDSVPPHLKLQAVRAYKDLLSGPDYTCFMGSSRWDCINAPQRVWQYAGQAPVAME